METSKMYLQFFEQEIAMLRWAQMYKDLFIYNDETIRQHLCEYYNKMSEEDKLYAAVTYGIPENRG